MAQENDAGKDRQEKPRSKLLPVLLVVVAVVGVLYVVKTYRYGFGEVGKCINGLALEAPRERHRATERLVEIGRPAVKGLSKALKDKYVARRAAEVLGRIGDPGAVEPLIAALQDEDPLLRGAAAEALGKIGDSRAYEPLMAMLQDRHQGVRGVASRALGQLGDPRAIEHLVGSAGQGDQTNAETTSVLSRLASEDRGTRELAFESLALMGESAVDTLIEALDEESAKVRHGAAEALGKIGDARAVDPLIALLEKTEGEAQPERPRTVYYPGVGAASAAPSEPDPDVRSTAVTALAKIKDARVVPALIARLKDRDANVRLAAATALGELDHPDMLEALIGGLKDSSYHVRRVAAQALGKRRDPGAVEPLIAALDDEHSWVRTRVIAALTTIGDPRAVKPLIGRLGDEDHGVRLGAVQSLGKLEDARAVEPLVGMVKNDQDANMRRQAIEALALLGGEKAVVGLCEALKDKESWVRSSAARGLEKLRDPHAIPLLKAALEDKDVLDKGLVAATLEAIDPSAIDKLVARMESSEANAYARRQIASKLAKHGEPGIKALAAVMEDKESSARTVAAQGLGRYGDESAVAPLIAATKDEDPEVRKAAAWGLAWFDTSAVQSAFDAALDQDALEIVAGGHAYFIRRGTPSCEKGLRKALAKHGDKDMARSLLHCGNERLAKAAEAWLMKNDPDSGAMMSFGRRLKWGESGKPE